MSASTPKKREKSLSPVQAKVDSGKANKRSLENKKLEEFNILQKKLYDCQDAFIAKLQTVKSPEPLKDDCQFFSISKNAEGKLVAKGSHLHKIPEDLLNDLKEKVRKGAKTSVKILMNSLETEPDEINRRQLQNEIEKQQLQLIFDAVNESARIAEMKGQNCVKELREKVEKSEKALELVKQEVKELKNSHAKQLENLKADMDAVSKTRSITQRNELSRAQNKLATLSKQQENLKPFVLAYNTDKTSDEQKSELIKIISNCERVYTTLNEKVNQLECRLRQNEKEQDEEIEQINTLEVKLARTKQKLKEAECTTDEINLIASLGQEIEDLKNCVEKLEEERKCLEERRDALLQEHKQVLPVAETLCEQGNGSEVDCQDEILKLQESEAEKTAEIENLTSELSNVYEEIRQRELQRTEIKQELIKEYDIQTNNKRRHVQALLAKQTEIQKLQMKVQQLEEENKQSQILRAQQEKTISHLKNRIANLKH